MNVKYYIKQKLWKQIINTQISRFTGEKTNEGLMVVAFLDYANLFLKRAPY